MLRSKMGLKVCSTVATGVLFRVASIHISHRSVSQVPNPFSYTRREWLSA